MKYLKLYESWKPLSKSDLASAQELHDIGVVSDKELQDLEYRIATEKMILKYDGIGGLNLIGREFLTGLPDGLKVSGYLELSKCINLKSLPTGLEVTGDCYLCGCINLESLPADLKVSGSLNLKGCIGLTSLPAGLKVGGYLEITGCTGLKSLPNDLMVDGPIYR